MLSLLSTLRFSCKDEVFAYLSPFTFFDTLWTCGGYQYDKKSANADFQQLQVRFTTIFDINERLRVVLGSQEPKKVGEMGENWQRSAVDNPTFG